MCDGCERDFHLACECIASRVKSKRWPLGMNQIIWCCSWTAWCRPCQWWSRWPNTLSSPLPSPQPLWMKLRRDRSALLWRPRTTASTTTRCCCTWQFLETDHRVIF